MIGSHVTGLSGSNAEMGERLSDLANREMGCTGCLISRVRALSQHATRGLCTPGSIGMPSVMTHIHEHTHVDGLMDGGCVGGEQLGRLVWVERAVMM